MALPNKTFWVNYNARNYNSTTLTIPKENGQLFNEDLVLPGSVTFTDDHIAITGDKRIHFTFNNTSDNIFNRTINTANVTIIAKVSPTNSTWFFSNRNGNSAVGMLVGLGRKYQMSYTGDNNAYTSSTSPMIFTWRCGNGTQQYIAHSDNVTGTPYTTTAWVGQEANNVYFFGGNIGSECWAGDFYWLYMTPETLTDAEIQQVIVYNDHLHTFSISKSNARFETTGGTETVEIEAETTWTASTPSFVSVSPSTGDTETTQVTISCPSYTGETRREDVITFTDNDDYTLTFKARQNGNSAGFSNIYLGDNNLLSNTIFLGDNAVNTIYLGEEIIYSNGPFVGLKASPQSLAFNNISTTANITIRSSENWTITDDSGGWLSYSTTTGGTGKTVVSVTASTTQAERTATITLTSANYTATVGVTQKPVVYRDLYVTGTANIVTDFNPYTFYTQNNNYMKIVLCHDYAQGNNGYLYKTPTSWFSFESTIWGSGFNIAGTTGVIGDNGLPNIRTTNTTGNPITIILDNGTANGLQGEYTQTNTFTGNMPNDNLVFYETSQSSNYRGHLYSFAVYGQNDVIAHWYVGYDDGVNVGIEDLVTGNKFQPNGSNYTIQCSDL